MKCLANCKLKKKKACHVFILFSDNLKKQKNPVVSGPNGNEINQPMYPGFERDVFRTVAEHFQRLKEPLLTFQLYEIFVSILGKINTKD